MVVSRIVIRAYIGIALDVFWGISLVVANVAGPRVAQQDISSAAQNCHAFDLGDKNSRKNMFKSLVYVLQIQTRDRAALGFFSDSAKLKKVDASETVSSAELKEHGFTPAGARGSGGA